MLRGDDEGARVAEGVQDDALILHSAAGEPVEIHHQHRVIAAVLHVLEQPEHLRPGVETLTADHLAVGLDDVDVVGLCILCQGLPVLGQHLLRVQALLHAALAEVFCCVHRFTAFPG